MRDASLREFWRVLRSDWLAQMSGGFSVPFAGIAAFVDSAFSSAFWALMAASALCYCSYRLWRHERREVVRLLGELSPRLQVDYGLHIPGSIMHTTTNGGRELLIHRLRVVHLGIGVLPNCVGHVTSVVRGYGQSRLAGTLRMTWAPAERPNPCDIDLRSDVPEYLDVARVQGQEIVLCTEGLYIPNAARNLFSLPGRYTLTVALSAPGAVTQTIRIEIERP